MSGRERYLGTLFISVLSGSDILESYKRFRRRRSQRSQYRKVFCGADVLKCGGADPCGGRADPYVNIFMIDGGGTTYKIGRTKTLSTTNDPVWKYQVVAVIDTEENPITCVASRQADRPRLKFQMMDDDGGGDHYYADDLIGEATLYLAEIASGAHRKMQSFKLQVLHPLARDEVDVRSSIELLVHYEDMLRPTSSSLISVPGVYFKRSRGNKVRLYHDAHCEPGDFDDVLIPSGPLAGTLYRAENCWTDIYFDILAARHVVLICGWSVNTSLRLIRKGDGYENGQCATVGELLLKKAEEGCTVCVMVWDDVTSLESVQMAKHGLMGTYDEFTREFFRGTKVHCIVAKRVAGDDQGVMGGPLFTPLKTSSFTHHQKIVLCDTQQEHLSADDRRTLTAYVGGLDLTSGRYDTSRHQLYCTLDKEHAEDYYNGCMASTAGTGAPREPWHDIHSRVEGPAAWDVYQNYVERCAKESQPIWHAITTRMTSCKQNKQILDRNEIATQPPTNCAPGSAAVRSTVSWSCQVFRSIDTENAVFSSKYAQFFNDTSGLMTDKSVQAAYLYAIHRAKRFIYIENQYFLGSSQYWHSNNDVPCPHLVPYALAKRIGRAIRDNEEFTCYVMTPLFPEGLPTSGSVQEILHWQYLTIQFMYRSVALAIKNYNRSTTVFDYLQFWFPAAREQKPTGMPSVNHGSPSTSASTPADSEPPPVAATSADENVIVASYTKFQIYVHSKMILVDDEWICIGSCNINERSMAGGRDSEIAVGLFQDGYEAVAGADAPTLPKGDIFAFRLQLWQEHFHCTRPEFDDPGSLQCARLLFSWVSENLRALNVTHAVECRPGTTLLPLPHGHACLRPLECDEHGNTTKHEKWPHIINTSAPVIGVRSAMLPGPLTT